MYPKETKPMSWQKSILPESTEPPQGRRAVAAGIQTRDKRPGTVAHLGKKLGSQMQGQEHLQCSVTAEEGGEGE